MKANKCAINVMHCQDDIVDPEGLYSGSGALMSSVSGICADYAMCDYNTAKGAITNLTRAMALDYADENIRVNAVCPGIVRTDIAQHTFDCVPGSEESFKEKYPTHLIAEPVEVANAVVFLGARESDAINGINLPLDGGITCHTGQPCSGTYRAVNNAYYAQTGQGLTEAEFKLALLRSIEGRQLKKVLLLPPDFTRYNSNCGLITRLYWHMFEEMGIDADIMPALGSHYPVTAEESAIMFGDVPYEKLIRHNWRTDVVKLGTVPGEFLREKSEGLWEEPIVAEINHRVVDPSYDLIISMGQVVPHEVVGMGNYSKNLFVGVGGSDMINKSHMLGAIFGIERILGQDRTPVRELFDYALEHFLADRTILFVQTVCTVSDAGIHTHGLFIGEGRDTFEAAVKLALEKNITFVPTGIKKCVSFLDPQEFKSTWVGNKALYRVRKAMADGGELIILAPGIRTFGEDPVIDKLIRKYGYCGRLNVFEKLKDPANEDLRQMQGTAAHLIHGSVDGRFRVTYAVKRSMMAGIKTIGFNAMDIDEALARYDPKILAEGYQTLPDGEEIFFISNPALGLWINQETHN